VLAVDHPDLSGELLLCPFTFLAAGFGGQPLGADMAQH
jgi:hypothetical protein